MHILFLTDPAPDYLADLLYIGLCRVLGNDCVIDFPLKPAYHQPERRVHYIPQVPAHSFHDEDILSMVRDRQFELAVLSSPRPGVKAIFESISRRVSMPPAVLVDGEDDAMIRREYWAYCQAIVYFKRELKVIGEKGILGRWKSHTDADCLPGDRHRLHPLPLSIVLDQIPSAPSSERVIDVSYTGRVSHPKRKQAVDRLSQTVGFRFEGGVYLETEDRQAKFLDGFPRFLMKLKGDPVVTTAQRGIKLSSAEYYKLLRRSKMALSIRGGGFDTLRYWEIVASGTLLLSEQPDIEIPNNFVHGKQALFFRSDLSDLVDLVRSYAKDTQACAAMAAEGYKHLLQYHTCERRAEYALEMCRKIM